MSSYYFVGQSISTQGGTFVNPILVGPSFTGQMQGADGTAAAPAYSFTSDPNTGMYRVAEDVLGFATGGALRLTLTSGSLTFTGDFFANGIVNSGFGTVGAPAYAFVGDEDTGMWRSAANALAFSAGGAQAFALSAGGTNAIAQIGTAPTAGSGGRLYFGNAVGTNTLLNQTGARTLALQCADGAGALLQSAFLVTSQLQGLSTSSGFVTYYSQILTTAQTTSYTLVNLTDSAHAFHNTGAGAQTIFTLPTSAFNGVTYTLFNNTAFGLQIKAPTGDVIQFPGSASTAAGTQTSTTIGATVTLIKLATNLWGCVGAPGGTWVAA